LSIQRTAGGSLRATTTAESDTTHTTSSGARSAWPLTRSNSSATGLGSCPRAAAPDKEESGRYPTEEDNKSHLAEAGDRRSIIMPETTMDLLAGQERSSQTLPLDRTGRSLSTDRGSESARSPSRRHARRLFPPHLTTQRRGDPSGCARGRPDLSSLEISPANPATTANLARSPSMAPVAPMEPAFMLMTDFPRHRGEESRTMTAPTGTSTMVTQPRQAMEDRPRPLQATEDPPRHPGTSTPCPTTRWCCRLGNRALPSPTLASTD
jgi:hypothetical protein